LRGLYWSSQLSTNLRLLLDEAVPDPLAKLIRESSHAINVEYMRDLIIRGASDDEVVKYAKGQSRIVVTTERGMDHRKYPVCTHSGIIVIASRRRHEDAQVGVFRRFLLSGRRQEARDAVTFISEDEVRIKTHQGEQNFRLE